MDYVAECNDWIERNAKSRADAAKRLRGLRVHFPMSGGEGMQSLRRDLRKNFKRPKLTPDYCRKEATAYLAYSRTGWSNPYDTEYYSACGYDDQMYYHREDAREYAVKMFRVWKVLTGRA